MPEGRGYVLTWMRGRRVGSEESLHQLPAAGAYPHHREKTAAVGKDCQLPIPGAFPHSKEKFRQWGKALARGRQRGMSLSLPQ